MASWTLIGGIVLIAIAVWLAMGFAWMVGYAHGRLNSKNNRGER